MDGDTEKKKKIMPFQSNGLPGYLIGHYNDPNFGSTTAHFLGQLTPGVYNPSFGDNTVLDSVILTIPYFSKLDDETYTIDSLYGNGPIKLSIFKNDFFLMPDIIVTNSTLVVFIKLNI